MSIEKALADLTAALDRNTAALNGGNGANQSSVLGETPAKRGPGRPSKFENAALRGNEVASQPVAPAAVPAPAGNIAPAATAAIQTVSFKEIADELSALVNAGGRDKGIALLAKFGAAKASELKPAVFAPFLAEVKALNKAPTPAAQTTSLI